MGKVGTVCIRCVPTLHRMRVESRLLYTTISQRSYHVQHSTCNKNVAIHSKFNTQEFQARFSTLYCTVSKCVLHRKSVYTVHTVFSYIAEKARCITGVLYHDIAAILPCTALYVQQKCSHTLQVQHTRVSSWFFNIILYCKQVCFTQKKCINCAYGVFLHCTECTLNHGCFIPRYGSDPAMYSTLRATKMYQYTTCSTYKSFKLLFQHYIVL